MLHRSDCWCHHTDIVSFQKGRSQEWFPGFLPLNLHFCYNKHSCGGSGSTDSYVTVFLFERKIVSFLHWTVSLTLSSSGSLPPAVWCDPPWTRFSPAFVRELFADELCAPPAQLCPPPGSCRQPSQRDPTGSLVTALQHYCSHRGVRLKNLGSGGKKTEITL